MERYSNPVKLLGEGTYGKVFLCVEQAKDGHEARYVAIKAFKPQEAREQAQALALREARLLAACRGHANVVALHHAYATRSGQVYLVQEFVENSLVDQLRVHRPKGLPHGLVCSVIKQLLQALAHMHSRRVMHRDIKIQNVLLTDEGLVKLCDFGMAASLGPRSSEAAGAGSHANSTAQLTTYVITRWYRAPEVLLQKPYNEKVDVWSVGCLFAELLFNRPLFPGRSHIDQLALVAAGTAAILPQHQASLQAMYGAHGVNLPHSIQPASPSSSSQQSQLQQQAALYVRMAEMLLPSMKDFLAAALHPDPSRRASAAQLLQLPIMAEAPTVAPTPLTKGLAPPAEALAALGRSHERRSFDAPSAAGTRTSREHARDPSGGAAVCSRAAEPAAPFAVRQPHVSGSRSGSRRGTDTGEAGEQGEGEGWDSAQPCSVPGFAGTPAGVSGAAGGGARGVEPRKARSFIEVSTSSSLYRRSGTAAQPGCAPAHAAPNSGHCYPRADDAVSADGTVCTQAGPHQQLMDGRGHTAAYASHAHALPRRTSSSHCVVYGGEASTTAPQSAGGSAPTSQASVGSSMRRSSVRWADEGAMAAMAAAARGPPSGPMLSMSGAAGTHEASQALHTAAAGAGASSTPHPPSEHTMFGPSSREPPGGFMFSRSSHAAPDTPLQSPTIPQAVSGPPTLQHHHCDTSPVVGGGTLGPLYRSSSRLSTSSLSTDMLGRSPSSSNVMQPQLSSAGHSGPPACSMNQVGAGHRTVARRSSALSLGSGGTLLQASLHNSAAESVSRRTSLSSSQSPSHHIFALSGNNACSGSPAVSAFVHAPHASAAHSQSHGQVGVSMADLWAARARRTSRTEGCGLTSSDKLDRDSVRAWSMPRNVLGAPSFNGATCPDGSMGVEGFSDDGDGFPHAGYGKACPEDEGYVQEEPSAEAWAMGAMLDPAGGTHGVTGAGGGGAGVSRERVYLSLPPVMARRAKSLSSSQWAAVRGGMSTRQAEAVVVQQATGA